MLEQATGGPQALTLLRYSILVLGVAAATARRRVAAGAAPTRTLPARAAVAFGAALAVLNTLAAHALVVWSARRSTHAFLRAVLGGMLGRLVVVLAAVVAGVLVLGLPKVPARPRSALLLRRLPRHGAHDPPPAHRARRPRRRDERPAARALLLQAAPAPASSTAAPSPRPRRGRTMPPRRSRGAGHEHAAAARATRPGEAAAGHDGPVDGDHAPRHRRAAGDRPARTRAWVVLPSKHLVVLPRRGALVIVIAQAAVRSYRGREDPPRRRRRRREPRPLRARRHRRAEHRPRRRPEVHAAPVQLLLLHPGRRAPRAHAVRGDLDRQPRGDAWASPSCPSPPSSTRASRSTGSPGTSATSSPRASRALAAADHDPGRDPRMFTKPFALMIRLFANMLAGHMVITTLLLLIPLMAQITWLAGVAMTPVSHGAVALHHAARGAGRLHPGLHLHAAHRHLHRHVRASRALIRVRRCTRSGGMDMDPKGTGVPRGRHRGGPHHHRRRRRHRPPGRRGAWRASPASPTPPATSAAR